MTMNLSRNVRTLNEVINILNNVEFEINIESFSINDLKIIITTVTDFISYTKEKINCYEAINLEALVEYLDDTIENTTHKMNHDTLLLSREIAAYRIYISWLEEVRSFVQCQID